MYRRAGDNLKLDSRACLSCQDENKAADWPLLKKKCGVESATTITTSTCSRQKKIHPAFLLFDSNAFSMLGMNSRLILLRRACKTKFITAMLTAVIDERDSETCVVLFDRSPA